MFLLADHKYDEHCAPSILITFINMVLFKGADKTTPPCEAFMFPGQEILQKALVLLALLCVPWMLFIKPFILKNQNKKKLEQQGPHAKLENANSDLESGQDTETTPQDENHTAPVVPHPAPAPAAASHGGGGHGEEEFDFSEIFIHQAIHTIEYVLGSVSHTASYLRLWALSLAHARKLTTFHQLWLK